MSEETDGEKKAPAENAEEDNTDARKAPDADDPDAETDDEEEDEETREGISWPEEYGTPVDDEIKYANDNQNVVWQEFTNGDEDVLVFRVLDPSLGGSACAITKSFRREEGLPGRVTKIILEEGITGVGWTENPGVYSGAQGVDTFQAYTSLRTVVPCSSLRQIGWSAFRQCSALSSFNFAACPNLELINNQAFNPTTSMGTVDLSGCSSLRYIGASAFSQGDSFNANYKITLPAGGGAISFIGQSAFRSTGIETVDLSGTSLSAIANDTFRNCGALTEIVFPETLTEIKNTAFRSCGALTSVSLPDSLTTLGTGAFEGCGALESVSFSDSLTEIGKQAFKNCRSLTSVSFPDSLTSILETAFENCTALESVTFPKNLSRLANSAFSRCSGIRELTWNVEQFNDGLNGNEFTSANGFRLTIGSGVRKLPKNFFKAASKAGEVFFEGGGAPGHVIAMTSNTTQAAGVPMIESIKNNCYVDEYGAVYELIDGTAQLAYFSPYEIADYTVPASITAPDGTGYPVTTVAPSAFTRAPALQTVRFENAAQIASIGASAFEGVATLTKVFSGEEETTTVEGAIAFFGENVVGENAFRKTGLGYAVKVVYLVEAPETIGDSVLQTLPEVDGESEIEGLISSERHSLQDLTERICQSIRNNQHFPFYTYIFKGWLAEDGEIYAPGTELLLSAVNQDDTDGVVTFRAVWCGRWSSGKGTPSANFSLVKSAKTAADCIASGTIPPEDHSYYTPTLGGSIICAVGENGLIYPDELRAPSGSSNRNVGTIYETISPTRRPRAGT